MLHVRMLQQPHLRTRGECDVRRVGVRPQLPIPSTCWGCKSQSNEVGRRARRRGVARSLPTENLCPKPGEPARDAGIFGPRILACPSSPPVTIQAVSVKASAQWHLLPDSTQGPVAHDEIWLELLFWRFLLWSVPRSDAAGLYRALGQSFRKDANARCVQMETVRVMTRS